MYDARAAVALVKSLSDLLSDYNLDLYCSANLPEKEARLKNLLCLPTSLSYIRFLPANVKDFSIICGGFGQESM